MKIERRMNLFRWKILRALRNYKNGEADVDEIAFDTQERTLSVSRSLASMEKLGLTIRTGTRRLQTNHGYDDYSVFRLTKAGYQLLASQKES